MEHVMEPWRASGRYQVGRATAVQTLDGEQDMLRAGLAEVTPQELGLRITLSTSRARFILVLSDQEFDRLCREGRARKL